MTPRTVCLRAETPKVRGLLHSARCHRGATNGDRGTPGGDSVHRQLDKVAQHEGVACLDQPSSFVKATDFYRRESKTLGELRHPCARPFRVARDEHDLFAPFGRAIACQHICRKLIEIP